MRPPRYFYAKLSLSALPRPNLNTTESVELARFKFNFVGFLLLNFIKFSRFYLKASSLAFAAA